MTGQWRRGLGRLQMAAIAGAMVATVAANPAAAQPRTETTSGWPQFQGNARHAGFDHRQRTLTPANVHQLSTAWVKALPSGSFSTVAVTGGVTYAGAGDTVTAFDETSGTQLWQASLPGTVLGTPSVQRGLVLVGIDQFGSRHTKGFVEALNSVTGAKVWMKPSGALPGGDLTSSTSITTTPHRAYVSLSNARVDALSIRTGRIIWQSAVLPGCRLSAPSVADGLVVVGSGGTDVSALNESDGTLAWHDTLGTGCGESTENWLPAISRGTAYVGLLNGVASVKLVSGTLLWENQSITGVFFPLSVTSNAVIAGPNGGDGLVALSRADGSVVWQTTFPGRVAGTTTFGRLAWGLYQLNGLVKAVAFSRFTGRRVFSSKSYPDDIQGLAPVVNGSRVYVNLGNELLCLALPADG